MSNNLNEYGTLTELVSLVKCVYCAYWYTQIFVSCIHSECYQTRWWFIATEFNFVL